ncbi:hypothetical protein QEG98_33695 [Myxococcus sp. MxC21-1]|uniref:hypothetical protein n=1 Tax=Myxococcus sp. MxC21-1 TaxID=3041439 RepID=UPI00292FCC97|nr:hypothetical protein [Myxococcus sp. MxC21-1]WNZ60843.1 hypothetical protein QEG98_33695 [Myxococcus sp. MxC21-1]
MDIFIVGMLVVIGGVIWLSYRYGRRPSKQEKPAFVLGSIGTRAHAVLATVGEPVTLGRYGHGPTFHAVPVSFQLTNPSRSIETRLTCSALQLPLLQPGAPCELLLDPADPTRLMVASVQNSFGVQVPTEIGSSHFRW